MRREDPAQKQKKQAIILGALMLVLAVMGVRHFMPQPRTSSAAIKPPAEAAGTAATKQIKLTPVQLTWPMTAKGNPFADNGVFPPKPDPKPVTPPKVEPMPKPEPTITAEQIRDQALKALKLQGMILGAVPRAVVNGKPVAAGEQVDGFVVVSIEARRIVVRKSGFDVELELK